MEEKTLQQKAIEHYERMIEWAETQDQEKAPSRVEMNMELGESWSGMCCPYCIEFGIGKGSANCALCPLSIEDMYCCHVLWPKLNVARKWKTWIEYAKKILKYIKANG